jgi:hypothetical protein
MRGVIKKGSFAILVVAVILLVRPVEQTIAPEWQVTVVDDKGVRLAGIHVRETWRQGSVEDKDHEAVLETNAGGSVHFPKRTLKSSYFQRAFGCFLKRRTNPSQTICSPQASVWAFGPGLGTLHEDDTRDIQAEFDNSDVRPDKMVEYQESMIMLHHCPPGRFGVGCKFSDEYAPAARQ